MRARLEVTAGCWLVSRPIVVDITSAGTAVNSTRTSGLKPDRSDLLRHDKDSNGTAISTAPTFHEA